MELVVFLSLVVLVLVFIHSYYMFFFSRAARNVASIPGPRPLPVFGCALELGRTPVDILKNIFKLSKEHGFVIKTWLGPHLFLLVADPVFAEPFFTSSINIRKSLNYDFLKPLLGTGLLTSSGPKWKSRRKIITPAFHFKTLEGFLDTFNTHGRILINKLKKQAGGSEFDIHEYVTLYALDVICDTAMGVQLNVQAMKNCEYVSAVNEMAESVIIRSVSPWYFPDFIFRLSPLGRRQKILVSKMHKMSSEVIEQRKRELFDAPKKKENAERENDFGQKKRLAFLDLLLQHNKEGGNLSTEDIREEVDTFMGAGHDTAASALCFCLWCLAENPDCQQKTYEELHEIFGDSDRDCTSEDLTQMKYLECVIKESLRLYPTGPLFLRELDEDVKIEETIIVAGTTIVLAPIIMHRNPKYFPDPEKFDPERFTPENIRGRHPFAYVPFSAGPRNCIGQKFAMMELKAAISQILRNYKLTSGGRKIILSFEVVLRSPDGLFIKLENRK